MKKLSESKVNDIEWKIFMGIEDLEDRIEMLEDSIYDLTTLLCSVTINLAVIVDKLDGNSTVKHQDFMKSVKRDADKAVDLLLNTEEGGE